MKRKHKTYSKPKRPFDKLRLEEEAKIKKEFGLKNKREIWKADAKIKSIRKRAKILISASPEEQQELFEKLGKIGLKVNSIADILSLNKEDYMGRRLQTVLVTKKLATTPKLARQLITHKKVLINGKAVNSPSCIVPIDLENKISLKISKPKAKKSVDSESEIQVPSTSNQDKEVKNTGESENAQE